MVARQVNIQHVVAPDPEDDPPHARHYHCPLALAISLQWGQPVERLGQLAPSVCAVQGQQDIPHPVDVCQECSLLASPRTKSRRKPPCRISCIANRTGVSHEDRALEGICAGASVPLLIERPVPCVSPSHTKARALSESLRSSAARIPRCMRPTRAGVPGTFQSAENQPVKRISWMEPFGKALVGGVSNWDSSANGGAWIPLARWTMRCTGDAWPLRSPLLLHANAT